MNDDRQQNDDASRESGLETEQRQTPTLSRRKFAKLGALSVPLALSLSSKTALGANYSCTVSGTMSGNLSHPGFAAPCYGLTPGYWGGNNPHMVWPTIPDQYYQAGFSPSNYTTQQAIPFHAIFGGSLFMETFINNEGVSETRSLTLYQVIELHGGNNGGGNPNAAPEPRDPAQLGAHTVAALLNSLASEFQTNGFGPAEFGMSPSQVIGLYNDNIAQLGFTQSNHDSAAGDSRVQALRDVFKEWNEDRRDPNKLVGLFGG